MRRTSRAQEEIIDTSAELAYELNVSPRTSIESTRTYDNDIKKQSDTELPPSPSSQPTPSTPQSSTPIQPSIRLLFSLLSRRHALFLLCPAILSSLVAGGIAPFMTLVVGQAFDAFAKYPLTPNPPQSAKDALLRGVGMAAIELVGLAVGSLALGSLTSCLWIWTGEVNVLAVRKQVYEGVTGKEMVWFDTHMGASDSQMAGEDGPIGAGGLMAKFSRETDDIRAATSLCSGMLLQYLTTCFAALILAFLRSWALTLVILSAVPILMFIQALSQGFAAPLLAAERHQTGVSATIIERAVSAISTVKAFNAAPLELTRASNSFTSLRNIATRLNGVWGFTSGLAQFVMMAMFVQGFWFGAKLVRDGKNSAGDVMSVFWACLIATSNLQMCIPGFIGLARGKGAMVSLMTLIQDAPGPADEGLRTSIISTTSGTVPPSPTKSTKSAPFNSPRKASRTLRKITPSRCTGELALHNVTFAYPARSSIPVLQDVSLFLPANEMTFIVGSSGSGKSTVAQLLVGMYVIQAGNGGLTLDEQDVKYLDPEWIRKNVCVVGQSGGGVGGGTVIIEGLSLFDNIALAAGERYAQGLVTREEVEDACRMALLAEWVGGLEAGLDTILGGVSENEQGGIQLSGGQKQRLALARARVRNPSVLVLDEATSALDATSRILVFEALKRWRKNKTTIVITHDLSQIQTEDFTYVLKSGRVVEQGFRYDLEGTYEGMEGEDEGKGEFRKMMESQRLTGGFLPEKEVDTEVPAPEEEDLELEDDTEEDTVVPSKLKHQSIAIRPLTFGNWMFEVIADLTGNPAPAIPNTARFSKPMPALTVARDSVRVSRYVPTPLSPVGEAFSPIEMTQSLGGSKARKVSKHLSIQPPRSPLAGQPSEPQAAHIVQSRRFSLPFTPTSATFTLTNRSSMNLNDKEDDWEEIEFDQEKWAMEKTARYGRDRREKKMERKRWDQFENVTVLTPTAAEAEEKQQQEENAQFEARPKFFAILRAVFPLIPSKPLLFLGLLICVLSGLMTPLFSFLLSRLLFEVSIGGTNVSTINRFGGIVLGIAAIDGLFLGSKYFIMEITAMRWVTRMRNDAMEKVLKQDKQWFDKRGNDAPAVTQIVVKDADDARNLVSVVVGQCLVVSSMLGVGLVWAMIRGWQLTLAGLAIGPVFAVTMAIQSRLVAQCEVRNKRARESVARGYYDAIINIRGIRTMSFERIFKKRFDDSAERALKTGVRGAFVEGCTYGVSSGLIYLAEAMLFYVGAVLISKGLFTYLQMVEVLNLVVFTVTIGSQLMAFTNKIAKSVQATDDLNKLLNLDTNTNESRGILTPPISGPIQFTNIQFAYPERPEATILKDINFSVAEGECVAIVGSSGCGKSTIAALLQRLYEPDSGRITVGYAQTDLREMNIHHLRDNVSVVSQQPNLFDASIAENIRYGDKNITDVDIRIAAKAAHVHEFIMSLPQGYDTPVGENASQISGGQAQRLQIARALARPSRILILDECTSALDPENQAAVLETIQSAKQGRTTVMVTHKLDVMLMCDRILVVNDGEVAEQGTYEELMEMRGVFATLAGGGEWVGE
ncbi:P-loop containing nucleoside triphosphate hydrolase protein [Crepidotus variabilis]|uniref:P-loop containing nucleoside triphosphate hydrolase protein n=1 Tax=Crepidotus variabilis TaxID=179855 RepID=A0A9P6ELD3_9AGAR|nr:P-loop containing nucleoside triphosphate hydrolase protein [Crepidotus variabilis]